MLVEEHLYFDGCLKGITFVPMDVFTSGLGYSLES